MNAFDLRLAGELERAVTDLSAQADVIVLRGAGGNFSVGGDYKELGRLRVDGPAAVRRLLDAFAAACDAIAAAPVPVVAAVEGYALAGGFELLQSCDVVIVRDDARLGDYHVNSAMVPAGGGSVRLPRLVGRQRAMAHILTGEWITGAEAVAWGLAHRVADANEFESAVQQVAERLAGSDRSTLARVKALVHDGLALPLSEGLELERQAAVEHLTREDAMDRFGEWAARR
jgi:enoyl-CoA hydratase/carnithine racemase